ncbi:MAG TPA: bifunctional oligoribonuclease/PAP phosphatase NrnA [Bacteroidetes bacterium]|nr:bifunctional oligoribonuclease/PAP phosphatase NrnA [Bacteroidota bacterium]
MDRVKEISKFLVIPRDIVILSHRNPDGDAIGSSTALKLFLEKSGHTARIIFPSDFPDIYSFLPKTDDIIIYDFEKEKVEKIIDKTEVIFFLDFSGLDRIDKIGEFVLSSNALKIHIDHHIDPEPIADHVLWDTKASSTSELVFDFINLLNGAKDIDEEVAIALMTGIITDTGSFKYSTTSKTFLTASKLMEYNIDLNALQNKIYNSLTEKQLRLIGHALDNRMEIIPEYHAGLIYLTKQDYKDFDIQRGDTEGLVNYLLMIKNVKIAALITEQPTIIKISLRSKGDISVQEIARKNFNGGGHKNAAGGHVYAKLESVLKRFKSILPSLY